jgi:hypothetical protein
MSKKSLCIISPKSLTAGERTKLTFTYITDTTIPMGSEITFRFSPGHSTTRHWSKPRELSASIRDDVVYASTNSFETIAMKDISSDDLYSFTCTLPDDVKQNEKLLIHLGDAPNSNDFLGSGVQETTERKKEFHLDIELNNKNKNVVNETFYISVYGAELANIKAIVPQYINRGERFDAYILFEDKYGNLTSNADPETMIHLSHNKLRESLSWKLFIPESGYINVPNLYFTSPGLYELELKNAITGKSYYSPQIYCENKINKQLKWGTLHNFDSSYMYGYDDSRFLRHYRDELIEDFYSVTPHESDDSTMNKNWKKIANHIADFNEDERFGAFLGFLWVGENQTEGIKQFIFSKDHKSPYKRSDSKFSKATNIYQLANPDDVLAICSFVSSKSIGYDFAKHNPSFEKAIEVYNSWGSIESSTKEGNIHPPTFDHDNKRTVRELLKKGYKFAFTAGGIDTRGLFVELSKKYKPKYSPGKTAIITSDFTRQDIFNAISYRKTYVTSGARILIYMTVSNYDIGSIIDINNKPGLEYFRQIELSVGGDDIIEKIEIIRNGKVYQQLKGEHKSLQTTVEDNDSWKENALSASGETFMYYYIRATFKDGHVGITSPVWITDNGVPN